MIQFRVVVAAKYYHHTYNHSAKYSLAVYINIKTAESTDTATPQFFLYKKNTHVSFSSINISNSPLTCNKQKTH